MTTSSSFADELVARLHDDLTDLATMALSPLDDAQIAQLLETLTAFGDRLTHATSRVIVEAHQRSLADKTGARHTANWWAKRDLLTKSDAMKRVNLALGLDKPEHEPIATALADGDLHTDQARVILESLHDLPKDLESALYDKARDMLLGFARQFDASDLAELGKGILEKLDPQRFEDDEAKRLQKEEDEANAKARITFSNDGHGRIHGRFSLPVVQGQLLRNQLLALADPRRQLPGDPDTGGASITPERMGQAFMELIEMFPADKLPTHAASSVALVITIDINDLLKKHGYATLVNGGKITAGEFRRLSCRTGFLPAMLDGPSEVLDLGRLRRFYSAGQYRALVIRDKGCTALGCGMPASVCHAHHDDPWSQGGPTDLAKGRLLCPHHHRLIHHPDYDHSVGGDNSVRFRRIQAH
ncbi:MULTISPECIES: HNH endonuclease signature motif containing protein [unclassified Nocardioides]|uniref:HNH endonuclease signature motif containing protein n=1 Tax=unclassified Nocardioides TaxID=2615069 RepID=UPI0006FC243B|nr:MULTISPECIES: DUF222 domain-containing protein [unclassified Nocardioides]KQY51597.1 hypothetical protein ASD30_19715 [Nocardioides sp. Root140]KRF11001.1 hypothetical protein ASH02_19375 [Nocardioides sp. Soil796]